jgi:hypothetical protein
MKRRVNIIYRAVVIEGMVHGGGGAWFSDWFETYHEAMAALKAKMGEDRPYHDHLALIEVREQI